VRTGFPGSCTAPSPFPTRAPRGRPRERGQALVFSLFAALLVILGLFTLFNMGELSIEKVKLQNTADAAAYSAMVAEARDYNFSAYMNRAMVVNQVAVAQFVGLTSWFRNQAAFANGDSSNWGREYYDFMFNFGDSVVARLYQKFLKGYGDVTGIFNEGSAGSTFMGVGIKIFDGLIMVYRLMEKYYHFGTALTVAETLGLGFDKLGDLISQALGGSWFTGAISSLDASSDVITANDPDASLTRFLGYGGLLYHFYQWYKFTEEKDPHTGGSDGTDADRFASVAMNSLDMFSRDRSTKPAWGFYFFYAPPLTYVDPTVLIPNEGPAGPLFMPVIHRGGTELKVIDGSSAGTTPTPSTPPDGTKNCHGQPQNPQQVVDVYSHLPNDPNVQCDMDQGATYQDEGSNPAGPYYYSGGNWLGCTAGDPHATPPVAAQCGNGSTGSTPPSTPPIASPNPSTGSGTGTTPDNKAKTAWTAMDASSFAGLDIFWLPVVFVPIPLPFAPPWLPLSHGGAYAGHDAKNSSSEMNAPDVLSADNNFSVTSDDAYGKAVSDWTTTLPAQMQQSAGAGKSLDLSNGGLQMYRDVADTTADNLSAPPLLIEVEKSVTKMPSSPGSGRFTLTNGTPQTYTLDLANLFSSSPSSAITPDDKYMRVLTKAEVYFSRPTNDTSMTWFQRTAGTATQTELGSLYNPYWQARLAPNGFAEQYMSMEMHQIGL
jgi:Putative Flp pilus-assembly TadE/G-like